MGEVPLYGSECDARLAGAVVVVSCISGRYRGTSLIRKRSPPYEPPMTLGMVLLQSPGGRCFIMSEIPLYMHFDYKTLRLQDTAFLQGTTVRFRKGVSHE